MPEWNLTLISRIRKHQERSFCIYGYVKYINRLKDKNIRIETLLCIMQNIICLLFIVRKKNAIIEKIRIDNPICLIKTVTQNIPTRSI